MQLPGGSPTDHELLPTYEYDTIGALPSPAQYLGTLGRLAYIFYIHISANSHRSPAKLSRALEEVENVHKSLPLHLSSHFPANADDEAWEAQHTWVTFQRYLVSHVIDFMRLSIARALLLSADGEVNEAFRAIASASAIRILEYAQLSVPRMYRIVWYEGPAYIFPYTDT